MNKFAVILSADTGSGSATVDAPKVIFVGTEATAGAVATTLDSELTTMTPSASGNGWNDLHARVVEVEGTVAQGDTLETIEDRWQKAS